MAVQGDSLTGIASKATENMVPPSHAISADVVKILQIPSQKHFRI